MHKLTELEQNKFMKALEDCGKAYDPEEKMLATYLDKPAVYASTLTGKAHYTRESLIYAVALLDSGLEENRQRAIGILEKVVSLHDADPNSKTYGIWSWYLEEPLDKMSPPDFNWADFCGVQLLQVLLDHSDRISAELLESIKKSIVHACNSIMKRKVSPTYTNIAIMDVYVTLVAGELLGSKEIFAYGKEYMKIFYDFTKSNGTFTEYNSPTYTITALTEITRILDHAKDEECLAMADELHKIAWGCIAIHYHPASGQWAGPHSRCYNSLQDTNLWSMLQLATDGKAKLVTDDELKIGIDYARLQYRCPDEYISYFLGQDKPRTEKEIFKETYYVNDNGPAQETTTYQSLSYSLGSFRVSDLWNQRSALIAYWGDHKRPVYMRLRCLKNGFDYSSAVMNAVQSEGNVLSIVNFAIDGGDTHLYLDKVKDATIKAKDLRLRIEFGGAVDSILLPEKWEKCKTAEVICADAAIKVNVPYCEFSGHDVRFEASKDDRVACLDVVFYSGDEKDICFTKLGEAVCGFALSIYELKDMDHQFAAPQAEVENGRLYLKWHVGAIDNKALEVSSRIKPAKMLELYTER